MHFQTNLTSFINNFKGLAKNKFFFFICEHCQTGHEQTEASTIKEQMAEVVKAVTVLSKEVSDLKAAKQCEDNNPVNNIPQPIAATPAVPPKINGTATPAWKDPKHTEEVIKKDKVTVCIKSGGNAVNLSKVKEAVTKNGIQIIKASVNQKNGDVFVDFPSIEQRDKLVPLLNEATPENTVHTVKNKCPVITIRNVLNFVDEADFIEKIKSQNQSISEKLAGGSEFSIVFTKQHEMRPGFDHSEGNTGENTVHQIVARVSEDIRHVIKTAGDKIFVGLSSLRVFDRFYVKSCAQCHRYGHYHADCDSTPCCGYCGSENHLSKDCPIHQAKEETKYKCVNCKDAGKPCDGHSSHWHKCPTYIEQQKKMMKNIPYYAKNC